MRPVDREPMMDIHNEARSGAPLGRTADLELPRLIQDALGRLRFGTIHLTIHEGKLVQVDVTERTRLPA